MTTAAATTAWTLCHTPVGELLLTTDGAALTGVFFERHRGGPTTPGPAPAGAGGPRRRPARAGRGPDAARGVLRPAPPHVRPAARPRRHRLPARVWTALLDIPYGTTTSYGEIARRLGLPPSASRAVGLANGSNPISIIVPCHRVVGADGSLTGYGGGLDRKRYLLDLEADLLF